MASWTLCLLCVPGRGRVCPRAACRPPADYHCTPCGSRRSADPQRGTLLLAMVAHTVLTVSHDKRDGSRRFQLHAMRKSPSAPRGCWLRGRWWIPGVSRVVFVSHPSTHSRAAPPVIEGRRCRRRRRQRAQDVLAAHALCSRTARGLTVMAVARRYAARLSLFTDDMTTRSQQACAGEIE